MTEWKILSDYLEITFQDENVPELLTTELYEFSVWKAVDADSKDTDIMLEIKSDDEYKIFDKYKYLKRQYYTMQLFLDGELGAEDFSEDDFHPETAQTIYELLDAAKEKGWWTP